MDRIALYITTIRLFLKKPYGIFENKLHRLILAISVSCFVWFMLFSLGIFEFDYFVPVKRFGITGVYSFFCLVSLAINFFLLQDLFIKKGTYGNSILWSFWLLEGIAISNFLLTTRLFRWEEFSFNYFMVIQTFTIALGFLIIPLLILFHYIIFLKTKLSETISVTHSDSIKPKCNDNEKMIFLESEYKNDSFSICLSRLLYIKSADNYADVYYTEGENNKVTHRLLRNSLTRIEQKQTSPLLLRCHRSYIVNKNHIRSIRQKNPGSFITIDFTADEIPLSRKYKDLFSHLK